MLRSMFAAVSGSAGPPDVHGRRRQQHRQRQHDRLQVGHRRVRGSAQPDAQRRGRADRGARRRYEPRAGRPRRAPRRHRHELLAGRRAGDRSLHRLRDPGRRLLRRATRAARSTYTRNGSFSLDGLGQLVTADGGFVQGWQADQQGNVNTNANVGHAQDPGRPDRSTRSRPRTMKHRRQPAVRLRGRAPRSTCRST